MNPSQGVLGLNLPTSASFENFCPGPNLTAFEAVQDFCLSPDDGQFLLLGPNSSGKTHLLQSACKARWDAGRSAVYLSPSELRMDESSLEGMPVAGLIAVDGIECLGPQDEMGLLRLIDRVRVANGKILLSSRIWPEHLRIDTPDLQSRLQWGVMLELRLLDEPDLLDMLHQRARLLGVVLPPKAAEYMLKHIRREPGALIATLDQAYERAVLERRKLNLVLIKKLLDPAATHE